jgi:hypothetical protein
MTEATLFLPGLSPVGGKTITATFDGGKLCARQMWAGVGPPNVTSKLGEAATVLLVGEEGAPVIK